MKIGYLTEANPVDKLPWSGTIYNIYQAMKSEGMDVVWIPVKINLLVRVLMKLGNKILSLLHGNGDMYHTKMVSFLLTRSIDKKKLKAVDIIFSPAGSVYLAYIKTSKPVVYCTDATFHILESYYGYLKHLSTWNVQQGNWIESKALCHSTYIVPASNWAARSVVNDYGIKKEKVVVIEFGANLEGLDVYKREDDKCSHDTLHVLFCGVDWERKGGEVACETCIALNDLGVKTKLTIVGIREVPERYRENKMIDVVGFLNKNKIDEYQKLIEIYRTSDVFLLPTQAECAGIVFAEASAFGLPCFTYDTGGIANYVQNGVNGFRLPIGKQGIDFALKIKEVLDNGEMEKLREGCVEMYRTCLNWRKYVQRLQEVFLKVS